MKKPSSDRTGAVPFSRHSGAPTLDATDYLESPKGQDTIKKAARFAARLKLESVGQLPNASSEPA